LLDDFGFVGCGLKAFGLETRRGRGARDAWRITVDRSGEMREEFAGSTAREGRRPLRPPDIYGNVSSRVASDRMRLNVMRGLYQKQAICIE